jgi:hypothetical protein
MDKDKEVFDKKILLIDSLFKLIIQDKNQDTSDESLVEIFDNLYEMKNENLEYLITIKKYEVS